MCRVNIGNLRVTAGHCRVTRGNHRLNIGQFRLTPSHLIGLVKVNLRSLKSARITYTSSLHFFLHVNLRKT